VRSNREVVRLKAAAQRLRPSGESTTASAVSIEIRGVGDLQSAGNGPGSTCTAAARKPVVARQRALLPGTDVRLAQVAVDACVLKLRHLDVDVYGGHLPLHNACKDRAMSELLLAHGADPRARVYGGTAAEWARHADALEMARFFAEHTRDLLDAVLAGHVALATELLREDPSRIRERDPGGATALHLLPDDPELARPLVELLLAHGIDTTAVDRDGRTAAASLEAEGLDELADLLDAG
jgi:hypothetical protein